MDDSEELPPSASRSGRLVEIASEKIIDSIPNKIRMSFNEIIPDFLL